MEFVTSLISLKDFSCFLACDAMWLGGYATTFRINRLTISSYTMKIQALTAKPPDSTTCNLVRGVRVNNENPVLASPSVCLSILVSAAPTGRIFDKFEFYLIFYADQIQIWLNRTTVQHTLHEDVTTSIASIAVQNIIQLDNSAQGNSFISVAPLNSFVLLTAACRPTTIQMEGIVAFPQQQWLCESATLLSLYVHYLSWFLFRCPVYNADIRV